MNVDIEEGFSFHSMKDLEVETTEEQEFKQKTLIEKINENAGRESPSHPIKEWELPFWARTTPKTFSIYSGDDTCLACDG